MAEAERTCALSRTTHPREELVRLVASPDDEVVVDYHAKLPGRGLWILPDAETLKQLGRKKGLVEHELGARMDVDAVLASVRAHVLQGIKDGMTMAEAAGALVIGRERLTAAIQADAVVLVGISSDASERTVDEVRSAGEGLTIVALPWTSEELGAIVGRKPIAAFGAPSSRPGAWLRRQLRRLSALG